MNFCIKKASEKYQRHFCYYDIFDFQNLVFFSIGFLDTINKFFDFRSPISSINYH